MTRILDPARVFLKVNLLHDEAQQMSTAGIFVRRLLMVAVPTALGVVAIFYAGGLKKLPEATATTRQAALVRVITLEPIDLIPTVGGFGTVAPVREWRAVARIEGEVTEIAQPLAPGDSYSRRDAFVPHRRQRPEA